MKNPSGPPRLRSLHPCDIARSSSSHPTLIPLVFYQRRQRTRFDHAVIDFQHSQFPTTFIDRSSENFPQGSKVKRLSRDSVPRASPEIRETSPERIFSRPSISFALDLFAIIRRNITYSFLHNQFAKESMRLIE